MRHLPPRDAYEQDAFTRWRRYLHWRPGEIGQIKRRAAKRERLATRSEISAMMLGPAPESLFIDYSDCQHGCNGDCERTGSPICNFMCHGRESQ